MRQTPGQLGGPIQITPQRAIQDSTISGSATRFVAPGIIDLAPFSALLAKRIGQVESEAEKQTEEAVRAIGQRVAKGDDLDTVLREYSSNNETPSRVKSKLSKAFRDGNINPTYNPAFLQQYYSGLGDIRTLAAREAHADPKVINALAQAGVDAGENDPHGAIMAAVMESLSKAKVYEGMGPFGTASVDQQMRGVASEVLQAATGRYRELVVQQAEDSFGAAMLLHGRRLSSAVSNNDSEAQAAALEEINAKVQAMSVSGYPDPRKLILASVEATAQDVASGPGGSEAAADFIETMLGGLKSGGGSLYDNDNSKDETALLDRARLLQLEQRYRDNIELDLVQESRERAAKAAKLEDELNMAHSAGLFQATSQGPAAINGYLNAVMQAAIDRGDGEEVAATKDWIDTQRGRATQQWGLVNIDDEAVLMDINRMLIQGKYAEVSATLRDSQGTGLLTTATQLELFSKLTAAQRHQGVFNTNAWIGMEDELKQALSLSPQFSINNPNTGEPTADRAAILPVAQELTDQFYASIYEELTTSGQEIAETPGGESAWIQRKARDFIKEQTDKYLKVEKAGGSAVANKDNEIRAAGAQKRSENTISTLTQTVPPIAGLTEQSFTAGFKRHYEILKNPAVLRVKASSYPRAMANALNAMLSRPITTTDGKVLEDHEAKAFVSESFAYAGELTSSNLLGEPLPESFTRRWVGLKPGSPGSTAVSDQRYAKALGAYLESEPLDLDGVDIYRAPLFDIVPMIAAVDTATRSIRSTSTVPKEDIERVRELLSLYGLPSDDSGVAEFIIHQGTLVKTLFPAEFK